MPSVRPARTVLHIIVGLACLAAATADAAAQDRGCVAGASVEQISRQLAQAKAQARNLGCTGMLALFRPQGICTGVTAQVHALEARLREARRTARPTSNFIVHIPFGERAVVPDCGKPAPRSAPRVVCVRLCDGYYFPVNHAIKQKNLAKDEQKCLGQYPEGEAALFIDRSGGENVATMVSLDGKQKYGDQPFAFAFQQSFNPNCPRPGAHLAEAARSSATASATLPPEDAMVTEILAEAVPTPAVSATESVSAAPVPVRLVGPPYAYYFPERETDDVANASATIEPRVSEASDPEIGKVADALRANVNAILNDEQVVLSGD